MSFLRNYAAFTTGNECPINYHLWCGIASLSAIVSRRVWIDMGIFTIYPNLYLVLLGEPGNGKTTAMRIAKNLVRELPNIPFSGEAQTKESLVRNMRDSCAKTYDFNGKTIIYTPITIFITELSHFFGPNSGHMIDFLTTIYDENRYEAKTKNKGDDILEGPYVTMLACTTQEWVTAYLKADIIGGGFTRRVIFVNEPTSDDKTRRIAFPKITDEQVAAGRKMLEYARELEKVKGPLKWEPSARTYYEQWYINRDVPNDPDIRGYYRTRHVQILKVAILICLSESLDMTLSTEHIQVATALLEKTETTLKKVFQGIGRNELNVIANRAMDYLGNAPEHGFEINGTKEKRKAILEKQLRGLMFRDAPGRECDDIISHLISMDKILRLSTTDSNNITRIYLVLK